MTKVLSLQNLLAIKNETFDFKEEEWRAILGLIPTIGQWIIYGKDKNGKTAIALQLVKLLSRYKKVLYISAEEGTDALFQEAVIRTGLVASPRLGFVRYMSVPEMNEKFKKRNAPEVIFLDNMSVYKEEFKRDGLDNFLKLHKDKLIIFLAHENRNEPDHAAARDVKKWAKVIIRSVGLMAHIGGRCPGGQVIINEEKADLYGIELQPN